MYPHPKTRILHSSAKVRKICVSISKKQKEKNTQNKFDFADKKKKKERTAFLYFSGSELEPTGFQKTAEPTYDVQKKNKNSVENIFLGAEVRLPTGNLKHPPKHTHYYYNNNKSSALLHHGASRGGVQLLLDEPEARTQFENVPEGRGEAGAHEQEVPQAGPGAAVLLEHQRELEGGHHRGVVHDALQTLAALVQLQVDVEDAAPQAAGLAGR